MPPGGRTAMTNENRNELKQIINALCDQPPTQKDDELAIAMDRNLIARALSLLASVTVDGTLVHLAREYEQRTGAHRGNARVASPISPYTYSHTQVEVLADSEVDVLAVYNP